MHHASLNRNHTKGGGYDAVIKSAAEPDVDPTHYSTSQGANIGICALIMPYLLNKEDFHNETNFHGFYTQGVKPNCKHTQSYQDHEFMNFIVSRFLIPSICEYQPLEGDFSPTKNRPKQNLIMELKMDFLFFQQDRNEENWSLNYRVMKDFPKPAKHVLHLPQLEANRFNQLKRNIGDQEIDLDIQEVHAMA